MWGGLTKSATEAWVRGLWAVNTNAGFALNELKYFLKSFFSSNMHYFPFPVRNIQYNHFLVWAAVCWWGGFAVQLPFTFSSLACFLNPPSAKLIYSHLESLCVLCNCITQTWVAIWELCISTSIWKRFPVSMKSSYSQWHRHWIKQKERTFTNVV